MNNFTLTMKQALETLVESGTQVCTVSYDPSTVVGDPEGDAVLAGWIQYYREVGTDLIEVIYTM